ncbi:MAG: exodeoxyribonuclease VII large subunit [Prevotella sp.]|nr:exodeoxyribonuclease VII large subunit [Prevotella sp.]
MSPTLTLYELNTLVREVIEQELSHEYWVEAELSEARESRGHCYMELVQKDELSNTPIARASAKCWRSSWTMIQPHFERVTGQRLHAGMKVRLKVYAQFHEAFGFAWIVTDIDPNFTLGDLARRRQEIIRQLKEEGVFDLQKELALPLFCMRIAVISSETAAGYGDFCRQLQESGFAFQTQLFPAIMQGEQVEQSIIQALEQIYTLHATRTQFDCVVIIRGGGATADMSGFDTLSLAEHVAQFPIPIITGIGHDRDECVLDMVSHLRVKTPTAAAAFLIEHAQQVLDRIDNYEQRITTLFLLVKTRQEARLAQTAQRLVGSISRRLEQGRSKLSTLNAQLSTLIPYLLKAQRHRLELLEHRAQSLDPQLLLKRGYSITLHNGRAVRDAQELKAGDEIQTRLDKGTIQSIVK